MRALRRSSSSKINAKGQTNMLPSKEYQYSVVIVKSATMPYNQPVSSLKKPINKIKNNVCCQIDKTLNCRCAEFTIKAIVAKPRPITPNFRTNNTSSRVPIINAINDPTRLGNTKAQYTVVIATQSGQKLNNQLGTCTMVKINATNDDRPTAITTLLVDDLRAVETTINSPAQNYLSLTLFHETATKRDSNDLA